MSLPSFVAPEAALDWLRQMLLIRRFEERSAQEYSAGKIRGFLHLYIGEEAVAVGVMEQLAPDDAVVAPKELAFLPTLPRTRSGKLMRRLLKARELGLPEGDTSTLEATP